MTARCTASLLTDYLARSLGRGFDWAGANCCHFGARWVVHAGEPDPMQGLPATPTLRDAVALVRQLGGDLVAAWTQRLGRSPVPVASAQLGDLVLVPAVAAAADEQATGSTMGICCGQLVVVATREGHHAYLPLSAGLAAWRLHGGAA